MFLEYAWDMAWCDPCAADPLSYDELRELGVFWLDGRQARGPQAQQVFMTRSAQPLVARPYFGGRHAFLDEHDVGLKGL